MDIMTKLAAAGDKRTAQLARKALRSTDPYSTPEAQQLSRRLMRQAFAPAPQPFKRGDIAAWQDEAVEVELISASGNATVRTVDGLRTVQLSELSKI